MRELSGADQAAARASWPRSRPAATSSPRRLPNLPDPDAPDGMTEEDAVVLREVGEPPEFDFEPRDHLEIGTELGPDRHGGGGPALGLALRLPEGRPGAARAGPGPLRDRARPRRGPRAGRPAGPGPRGGAVRDRLPPRRPRPDLRDPQGRALPRRHLRGRRWPRLHADQILDAGDAAAALRGFSHLLPPRGRRRRHATPAASSASTSSTRSRCSRSSSPTQSADEHERLLAIEERILAELEIPYRVVNVAVGDLGAPAAKKYDCEAWIPSQGRYRELTSCSNTTDYQARRLGCRYRPAEGESPRPSTRSTAPPWPWGGR